MPGLSPHDRAHSRMLSYVVSVLSLMEIFSPQTDNGRCPCGTQFCYLCRASPWKSCTCQQWDDNRLFARAHEVVQAENPRRRVALNRVLGMAENLAGRHNCQHVDFRSLRGAHRCEMCRAEMPEFIYTCLDCHIHICRRCKQNRL
jgi:hypothetical protein